MFLNDRMRRLRMEKRMTKLQLSKKSNIARGYLSELEKGKHKNPTIGVICRLCKGLSCTPNDLIRCENGGDKDE